MNHKPTAASKSKNKSVNKSVAMRERAENKGATAVEHQLNPAEQTKQALADVTDTIADTHGQKDKDYR